MTKGWFIGDFIPTAFHTRDVEVAVKHYNTGDYDPAHYHKIATEITVLISGRADMNGVEYTTGDIITIKPGVSTDFRVLADNTVTVVVKIPGATNDKYQQ